MKDIDLTICVPAHNEAAGIKTTLEGLKAKFHDAEIIVVNDGSIDETFELAKSVEGILALSHHQKHPLGGQKASSSDSQCYLYQLIS